MLIDSKFTQNFAVNPCVMEILVNNYLIHKCIHFRENFHAKI